MKTDKELFNEMGDFIVEPLTMSYFGKGWDREKYKFIHNNESDWVNPMINYFVEKFCWPSDFNNGYYDGPIIRIMIDDHKNKRHCHWAAMIPQEGYDLLFEFDDDLNYATPEEDRQRYASYVIGFTKTVMHDDVYGCPEQFLQMFPDVYESFDEFLVSETTEITFTPDIGLRGSDEDGWGWCT